MPSQRQLLDTDLNQHVLDLNPDLPKRNYARNLNDAWLLKNLMPVRYLPPRHLHTYHDALELAKLITLGYIRWREENG